MPTSRFYCPARLAPGASVALTEHASHHALHVLRMKTGDGLTLFNGDGYDYPGQILRIGKDGTTAKIISRNEVQRESPLLITLAQAISARERMDFTLQKAVELGVAAIRPLAAERSVVKLAGDRIERRREHWQNIVISACEQCGRAVVPEVLPPLPLADWLGTREEFALKLMLSPTAQRTLHDISRPEGHICLLTGCEGGFSPQEQQAAVSCNFIEVRLGARVLRTETAALAALAAMQALWGDF
jgi:16S rRNA (uracil1498-N3)-methyltransferase